MKLLFYITSHGYGHALRSSVICNSLSRDVEIVFRTSVPKEFFDREMVRPFTYAPAVFDCGCVQPDGNAIDVRKTLNLYRTIAEQNRSLTEREASWCREIGIDVIVSDIVPFAFDVAQRACLPSLASTNFTWHTIYEEYTGQYPDFADCLAEMRNQYEKADILLAMYPHNTMDYFKKRINVGPVGRVGRDVRSALQSLYGLDPEKKIGLIYTGNFGMADVAWKNLESFEAWEFLSLYPLPGSPKNYRHISTGDVRYQDCIASADVMITKLGYGACAECFINGLPIIYLPRTGFAEYPVLRQSVEEWGHAYFLSKEDYCSLNWRDALVKTENRPHPMPSDGALTCAQAIEQLIPGVKE